MNSIRQRLLLILLVASVLISLALASATAWIVRQKVGDLLDYQLEQVARTLLVQGDDRPRAVDVDPALHLEAQMWDVSGRLLWRTGDDLRLPANTPLGLASIPLGADGQAARVFTVRDAARTVQVAVDLSVRDGLAIDEGIEMLWPSLLSLVVLSFVIVLTVQHGLKPLRALDAELARRSSQSLAEIRLDNAPQELRRPLATLNGLLGRLDESLRIHRQFVAEAAHELRTPLAAIRLQASNVFTARDEPAREAARVQLMRGLDRAQHLVQQLLTLARFEPGGAELVRERVDLRAIAQTGLVDLAGLADSKNIELSLGGLQEAWVLGDADALRILIDNLVGNAIKYSPAGTAVGIELSSAVDGRISLVVRDEGPGIAAEARQRVFDRFERGGGAVAGETGVSHEPGSGLGLAIVADIVRAHGADITLSQPPSGSGLQVTIRFAPPG